MIANDIYITGRIFYVVQNEYGLDLNTGNFLNFKI